MTALAFVKLQPGSRWSVYQIARSSGRVPEQEAARTGYKS